MWNGIKKGKSMREYESELWKDKLIENEIFKGNNLKFVTQSNELEDVFVEDYTLKDAIETHNAFLKIIYGDGRLHGALDGCVATYISDDKNNDLFCLMDTNVKGLLEYVEFMKKEFLT